jgi:hypothetical protein
MAVEAFGARAAVLFWERGRAVFNIVLTVIVLVVFRDHLVEMIEPKALMGLVTLGIVANLFYCLAYPVDLVLQLSGRSDVLRRGRWGFLGAGLIGGSFVAWIVSLAVLAPLSAGAPF